MSNNVTESVTEEKKGSDGVPLTGVGSLCPLRLTLISLDQRLNSPPVPLIPYK